MPNNVPNRAKEMQYLNAQFA